ncbi:hypothetical protein [Acidomonas methanolica]|uniref:Copper resistance protein D domain-containing protein n=1 Tax=Acidomonas methanolica NBRC 104435 TaxID=1231351 RepID=A0A023D5I4_ACIMT|nr:hypothetical protein [Acidomonas methanolica]MBU2653155.1 hypothetical protein [Acidomonas methanolica]TCS32104.1 hypothetical protein EDC31_10137 [Acidomonas methanolica]GAJ29418.1 hypothetical protein Amme_060_054 [Acidomonas methanolica NBRC 104435]GBQ58351.1 hypothetical protein AA0498_2622 [Acidomonas methanolica]GEK97537.1 hypothetical protein AME01nite_00360 [Acidomonas methanolica NBRC 104435]
MIQPILWSLLLALHLLCMAYWVGGGLNAVLVARSGTALLDGAQRQTVLLQIYSRYCRALMHIVPVSLLSGWGLVLHLGGFAHLAWPINAMQALGVIMAALFVSIVRGPLRTARRAIRPQAATFATIRTRIVYMVALGILTTLCASLAGA